MTPKTKLLIAYAIPMVVGLIVLGFGLPFGIAQIVREKLGGIDLGIVIVFGGVSAVAIVVGYVILVQKWIAAAKS